MEKLFEHLDELHNASVAINREYKTKAEELIRKFLGNDIYVTYSEADEDIEPLTFNYDGGSHPEYASNCFSDLQGFGVTKDGVLYASIEDCDEYDISRWCLYDWRTAVEAIDNLYELRKEAE